MSDIKIRDLTRSYPPDDLYEELRVVSLSSGQAELPLDWSLHTVSNEAPFR